jgi:hypothetical protein
VTSKKKEQNPGYRPVQAGDLYQLRSRMQTVGLGLSNIPRFVKIWFCGDTLGTGMLSYRFPKFLLILRNNFFSSWEDFQEPPPLLSYPCLEPESQVKFEIEESELRQYYTFSVEAK